MTDCTVDGDDFLVHVLHVDFGFSFVFFPITPTLVAVTQTLLLHVIA